MNIFHGYSFFMVSIFSSIHFQVESVGSHLTHTFMGHSSAMYKKGGNLVLDLTNIAYFNLGSHDNQDSSLYLHCLEG